jgi:hypothetical protein
MYWKPVRDFWKFKNKTGWRQPTGETRLSFGEWLKTAVNEHDRSLEERSNNLYFRVNTNGPKSFLYDELPFFQPKESMFMVNPDEHRGINCRFGMHLKLVLFFIT